MEDVSAQSCRRDCLDGLVCGPDHLVSAAVWAADSEARPPRNLVSSATAHPSAEWISRQLMEAYGWEEGPCYLVRDRDSVYGEVFLRRLRAMGIRDRPTAPRSPWQNGYCERLIGSIRRECLDHILVFGERHLRHLLRSLCRLLQSYPNAPIIEQGLAGVARHRSLRSHIACANSGRIAPPIRQDLVSDRDSRATSSAIGIGSMAALSHAECVPWASGTSLLHRPRLGRMHLPSG